MHYFSDSFSTPDRCRVRKSFEDNENRIEVDVFSFFALHVFDITAKKKLLLNFRRAYIFFLKTSNDNVNGLRYGAYFLLTR